MTWTRNAALTRLKASSEICPLILTQPWLAMVIERAANTQPAPDYDRIGVLAQLIHDMRRLVGWDAIAKGKPYPLYSHESYEAVLLLIDDLLPPADCTEWIEPISIRAFLWEAQAS